MIINKKMLKAFLLSTLSLKALSASIDGCSGGAATCDAPPSRAVLSPAGLKPSAGKDCATGAGTCPSPVSVPSPSSAFKNGKSSPSGSVTSDICSDGNSVGSDAETCSSPDAHAISSPHSESSLSTYPHTSHLKALTDTVIITAALVTDPATRHIVEVAATALADYAIGLAKVTNIFITPETFEVAAQIIHKSIHQINPADLEEFATQIKNICALAPQEFKADPSGMTLSRILPAIASIPTKEERNLLVAQLQALSKLIPQAFKDEHAGITLAKVTSIMSSMPTKEERNLYFTQLQDMIKLFPEDFKGEEASNNLFKIASAMAKIPTAEERSKFLMVVKPLLTKSLDKLEAFILALKLPIAYLQPIAINASLFVKGDMPARKLEPILRVISRNFEPTNAEHIEKAINVTAHLSSKDRSSEDVALLLEGFLPMPTAQLEPIKSQVMRLSRREMSGKDIYTIIRAIAQLKEPHIEKVSNYTLNTINNTMSANDIAAIVNVFGKIVEKGNISEDAIEETIQNFKKLLPAIAKLGKIKYRETYAHMIARIADLPSKARGAIVEEALSYLANPETYDSRTKFNLKTMEDQLITDTASFSALKIHVLQLETTAQKRKAAAEKASKALEEIFPMMENHEKYAESLNKIILEARQNKDKKRAKAAEDEAKMASEARNIYMSVIDDRQKDLGTKSTAFSEAHREFMLAKENIKKAEAKLEVLKTSISTKLVNSAESIRLVDHILMPERVLGKEVKSFPALTGDTSLTDLWTGDLSSKPLSPEIKTSKVPSATLPFNTEHRLDDGVDEDIKAFQTYLELVPHDKRYKGFAEYMRPRVMPNGKPDPTSIPIEDPIRDPSLYPLALLTYLGSLPEDHPERKLYEKYRASFPDTHPIRKEPFGPYRAFKEDLKTLDKDHPTHKAYEAYLKTLRFNHPLYLI